MAMCSTKFYNHPKPLYELICWLFYFHFFAISRFISHINEILLCLFEGSTLGRGCFKAMTTKNLRNHKYHDSKQMCVHTAVSTHSWTLSRRDRQDSNHKQSLFLDLLVFFFSVCVCKKCVALFFILFCSWPPSFTWITKCHQDYCASHKISVAKG